MPRPDHMLIALLAAFALVLMTSSVFHPDAARAHHHDDAGAGAETAAPAPAAALQAGWAARKRFIVLANGLRLAYVEAGAPDGAPLMLLHGYTDTSRSWTQVLPALEKGRRLIIPDLRGHGASDKPECCYALADFAYDAKLLMDALEISRADIAGHSLGSMIAMEFAAAWPTRVNRLALIGSTGLAPLSHGDWLSTGVFALSEPLDYDAGFLAEWTSVDAAAPTPVDEAFLAHVHAEARETPLHVWRGVARALIGVPAARHAPQITAPVLIMAGGRDELFGAGHQAALRAALPDARYEEFDDLGHNLIWERPHETGPALASFFAE